MSYVNYPYHHSERLCTIVHFQGDGHVYDYCTVCHDSFFCFGAWNTVEDGGSVFDREGVAGRCVHPVADVSEQDARSPDKEVPEGHMRLHRSACVWEHYRDPAQELNGAFLHDTGVVYHRCTGCGSTQPCDSLRGPEYTCHLTSLTDPTEETT